MSDMSDLLFWGEIYKADCAVKDGGGDIGWAEQAVSDVRD